MDRGKIRSSLQFVFYCRFASELDLNSSAFGNDVLYVTFYFSFCVFSSVSVR
jgi:hypothetical protein